MEDHRFTPSTAPRIVNPALRDKEMRGLGAAGGVEQILNGELVEVREVGGNRSTPNRDTPSCSRDSIDRPTWLYRTRSGGTVPQKHVHASKVDSGVKAQE